MNQDITINGPTELPDRTTLRFTFSAEEITNAAEECAKHHRERLAWWETEHEKAQTVIEDRCYALHRLLEAEKQARVSECSIKIDQHRRDAEEYAAWAIGLATLAGQKVELSIQDVRFFRLSE